MEIKLKPERLIEIRKQKGMNKAEMADLLSLSKMGYGRYESGERNPSYQTICFMAEKLGTTAEYLTGLTDDDTPCAIMVDKNGESALFELVNSYINSADSFKKRLISYYEELKNNSDNHEAQDFTESNEHFEIEHTASEYEWDECTLVKYKGENIDDLLDGEDSCTVMAMCGVLEIVSEELKNDRIRRNRLKSKIKMHIEQECSKLIPNWQK